jgi:hypothetical protein
VTGAAACAVATDAITMVTDASSAATLGPCIQLSSRRVLTRSEN